ncbi:MAG: SDR family oxidoreductase [Rhodospirillales bacterium]|nr:SDR family oxidoreductase [Rhodospirillales bacterium]MDE2318421.1 SDR family oxidoreductase [Rhodospirillales bacterium]
MDLGIKSRTALVCAASAGLGRACALALAREGVSVTITGRNREALEETAEELRKLTDVRISIAVGDITTDEGRAAALLACPNPDILITNAGGPPPGDFRDFSEEDWRAALNANLLTPIALIRATVDCMVTRKFGRIVNITSSAVKSPIPSLALSNTARTGLTGFVAGLSRQVARHNVTINNLLPGPFNTARLQKLAEGTASATGREMEEIIATRAAANPAGRVGQPEEFGAMCAFLCSAQAGYIVGQNILLDGGAFNSTM